jgi:NADH-quinone oxidoreductase subunit N
MGLSAAFILLFVLPYVGGTLVDAASAAAAVLAPLQTL